MELELLPPKRIRKAVDKLYTLSANAQIRAEYEARKKAELDYINGMEGSYEKGRLTGEQRANEKWQGVLAEKDALIAELKARLGEDK